MLDADTGAIKRVWGAYGKPPTDESLPAYNADSPQFANPVHCIALSKDGFVFVCDRTNNRVQVFHKDGSFVQQYVFDPATRGPGSSRGLAFSPLDRKQNFFVLVDGSNEVLETVRRKDGAVMGHFGPVEPTRSENITVTWRRSARSSGEALVALGAVATSAKGALTPVSGRRAAMASSILSR